MRKLGGLLLSIGLFLGIGMLIMVLATDIAMPILEPFLCPENDTLIRVSTPTSDGESISFFCVDDDGGNRTNKDGQMFGVVFVLFTPVIIGSILMAVGGTRNAVQNAQEIMAQVNASQNQLAKGDSQLELKHKLRQLQEAYDDGLIDYMEFERRKELLLDDIVED